MDHVVLKAIVSASADCDASGHVEQVVGLDDRSTREVVKVDADNTCLAKAADGVNMVLPNLVATVGWIEGHVDCAGIVGLSAYVRDFIVLNHMLIAVDSNSYIRTMVNVIASQCSTDTVDADTWPTSLEMMSEFMDMAILDQVICWG